MAIERFTIDEFQAWAAAEVPTKGQYFKERKGEVEWHIPVYNSRIPGNTTNKEIVVRTSIDARTGIAYDTGQNSIRCWIRYRTKEQVFGQDVWRILGKDSIKFTKRTRNWRKNLKDRIRTLWRIALDDENKRNPHYRQALERLAAQGR